MDRVRARNDRADRDLPRILFYSARKPMTAYLLSLALIGLVAIVISEGLSWAQISFALFRGPSAGAS
jgi:hypothetical protein